MYAGKKLGEIADQLHQSFPGPFFMLDEPWLADHPPLIVMHSEAPVCLCSAALLSKNNT